MLQLELAVVVVLLLLGSATTFKVVKEHERGVKFTLGQFEGVLQPGLRTGIPLVQSWERVDVRAKAVDVPRQESITRDNVTLEIDAVICYRVRDAKKAILHRHIRRPSRSAARPGADRGELGLCRNLPPSRHGPGSGPSIVTARKPTRPLFGPRPTRPSRPALRSAMPNAFRRIGPADSRFAPWPSRLVVLTVVLLTGAVTVASGQAPNGASQTQSPSGRWVTVEVPLDVVNEARRAAGRPALRAKAATKTVTMQYQQPVERRWGLRDALRRSSTPVSFTPPLSKQSAQASDGITVIEGLDFDENGNLAGTLNIPADPHGAVGTNHVCHVVNVSIQCQAKDGSSVRKESLETFFGQGNDIFDPGSSTIVG